MIGQPPDLSGVERRQEASGGQELTVALGHTEATGSVDASPERAVLATSRPEAEFQSPLDGIEIETVGPRL